MASGLERRMTKVVYKTNMEDVQQETDKKNCTFLFKKRKVRSKVSRKRKGLDDSGKCIYKRLSISYRSL